MAVVERFKQESVYGLSAKKMVAVVEGWPGTRGSADCTDLHCLLDVTGCKESQFSGKL